GAGLVVGGLVGGILGNQVGGGNGKTAATVIGAVGGAVVGNNIEQNRNAQSADRYQINVRMDHGDRISILQDSVADLRNGDRVRVVDGHVYRD
ncbi:MAG: glycine zipper 2TM domain-containing protein, partial [Burkholderiaceae bacterium]